MWRECELKCGLNSVGRLAWMKYNNNTVCCFWCYKYSFSFFLSIFRLLHRSMHLIQWSKLRSCFFIWFISIANVIACYCCLWFSSFLHLKQNKMQFINNLVVNEQIIHNHNKRFVFSMLPLPRNVKSFSLFLFLFFFVPFVVWVLKRSHSVHYGTVVMKSDMKQISDLFCLFFHFFFCYLEIRLWFLDSVHESIHSAAEWYTETFSEQLFGGSLNEHAHARF